MTTVRRPTLADALTAADRRVDDMPTLAEEVCRAIGRVVPFGFGCLATIDPSTGFISWAWKTAPLDIGEGDWAAAEYGDWDVNQFAEIATRDEPVGVLSVDTGGQPHVCRRFREFLAPNFGHTDELRAVFRSGGLVWGALALSREGDAPPFTAEEGRLVAAVSGQVADMVKRVVFGTPRTAPDGPAGPSVIVVDGDDRPVNITAAAHARVDDLGGWDHLGLLPASVQVAIAAARLTPELVMTRVRGASGAWLIVRATTFAAVAEGATPQVVVTIDAATPTEISAMALAARGLSSREQDVTGLVLQGASTRAIALALHLSPHTVQDHLKSVFAKLGVNSRRELVAQLVLV